MGLHNIFNQSTYVNNIETETIVNDKTTINDLTHKLQKWDNGAEKGTITHLGRQITLAGWGLISSPLWITEIAIRTLANIPASIFADDEIERHKAKENIKMGFKEVVVYTITLPLLAMERIKQTVNYDMRAVNYYLPAKKKDPATAAKEPVENTPS